MSTPDVVQKVADIARELEEPGRLAELKRHYNAIFEALSQSHTNGEQDTLCVMEAIALMLGQLVGGMPADVAAGYINYVSARTSVHAAGFKAAGKAADYYVEGQPKPYGHA